MPIAINRAVAGAVAAVLAGALAGGSGAQERPPAPAPYCMDARQMAEAVQPDAHTLAIRLADDSRFRVELADACPGAAVDGAAALVARGGWVCGTNEEHVRVGERQCAVSGLARIDAEQFARLAQTAGRSGGIPTLAPVKVRGERRRGFAGSTSYCLDARQMRGWHEDADGVVIEVSPRRNGGHRYYRVELAGSCPELSRAESVELRSGLGQSAICGNPGDRVLALDGLSTGASLPITPIVGLRGQGCPISVVYPLEPAARGAVRQR